MEFEFGENFRGGNRNIPCPLCNLHWDSERLSYSCSEVRKSIKLKGVFEDIFETHIDKGSVETICKISELRRKYKSDESQIIV